MLDIKKKELIRIIDDILEKELAPLWEAIENPPIPPYVNLIPPENWREKEKNKASQ